jgi:hypothetical protein
MRERYENLPVPVFVCPDGFLDGRIPAVVALFTDKTVENPFGRMALFPRRLLIFCEDLFDKSQIRPDLPLLSWFCLSIPGRGGVG